MNKLSVWTTIAMLVGMIAVLEFVFDYAEEPQDPFGSSSTSAPLWSPQPVLDPHSLRQLQQAYADWDTGKLPRR